MTAGQYFDADPRVTSAPKPVVLSLPDANLRFTSDRGVFSHGEVDLGTRVLVARAPTPPPAGDLLDLGCGYGVLACVLAVRSPDATVWAIDVNERALALTAANAATNSLGNVRAVAPDAIPGDVAFATIWSNPPIRIGKPALHELLLRWLPRLTPEGSAHLVVHKHLGSDSLATWLVGQGWTVVRRASQHGFRVLDVGRP